VCAWMGSAPAEASLGAGNTRNCTTRSSSIRRWIYRSHGGRPRSDSAGTSSTGQGRPYGNLPTCCVEGRQPEIPDPGPAAPRPAPVRPAPDHRIPGHPGTGGHVLTRPRWAPRPGWPPDRAGRRSRTGTGPPRTRSTSPSTTSWSASAGAAPAARWRRCAWRRAAVHRAAQLPAPRHLRRQPRTPSVSSPVTGAR
jgi:hypothetical protein